MMNYRSTFQVVLFFLAASGLIQGCGPKISAYTGKEAFKSEAGIPDYSQMEYWAAHPGKTDPSDTVPKPLRGRMGEKVADVFFLHPTTYTGTMPEGETNARIDDPVINYKTDRSSILYQASAFNERARVFAPRYRQAHLSMYGEKDTVKRKEIFDRAYNDIRSAFLYYLQHENKGRPIVIASHSQGTTHSTRLIKEFFDGKPLSKQLVCAYLVGMDIKKTAFAQLHLCDDISSTGCFVSWRTFRYDYDASWASRTDTSVAVVNPVTWKTTNELAASVLHKGAVLYNLRKVFSQTHDTQLEGSAVWITRPRFPGSFLYKTKNYHAGDINLFYVDIRDDLSRRIDLHLSKK